MVEEERLHSALEQADQIGRRLATVQESRATTGVSAGISAATKGRIRASAGEGSAEASPQCAARGADSEVQAWAAQMSVPSQTKT